MLTKEDLKDKMKQAGFRPNADKLNILYVLLTTGKVKLDYHAKFDLEDSMWWICGKSYYDKNEHFDDSFVEHVPGMTSVQEAGYCPVGMTNVETKSHLMSMGITCDADDQELEQADKLDAFRKYVIGKPYSQIVTEGNALGFRVSTWSDRKNLNARVDVYVTLNILGIIESEW